LSAGAVVRAGAAGVPGATAVRATRRVADALPTLTALALRAILTGPALADGRVAATDVALRGAGRPVARRAGVARLTRRAAVAAGVVTRSPLAEVAVAAAV